MVKNSNNKCNNLIKYISFFFVQVVSSMYSILVVIFTVSVIDLSISDLKVSLLFEFHENWWTTDSITFRIIPNGLYPNNIVGPCLN